MFRRYTLSFTKYEQHLHEGKSHCWCSQLPRYLLSSRLGPDLAVLWYFCILGLRLVNGLSNIRGEPKIREVNGCTIVALRHYVPRHTIPRELLESVCDNGANFRRLLALFVVQACANIEGLFVVTSWSADGNKYYHMGELTLPEAILHLRAPTTSLFRPFPRVYPVTMASAS